MPLIVALNRNTGTLLPNAVKADLRNRFAGQKNLDIQKAKGILLNWTLESIPVIAQNYGIPNQVIDTIQHYRFGFVQAERLLEKLGSVNSVRTLDKETICLFTSVHDIGRMMVGSGASKDLYRDQNQGNILHSIVGAMMWREVLNPIIEAGVSEKIKELFEALIYTAERHTLSIGLPVSTVQQQRICEITIEPYSGYRESLMLVDANLGKYGRYAHLVALADLINNVSAKLSGTIKYDSLVGVEKFDINGIINYIMNGPENGQFKVWTKDDSGSMSEFIVERFWRNEPLNPSDWIEQMKEDATQFSRKRKDEQELALVEKAFEKGIEIALGREVK